MLIGCLWYKMSITWCILFSNSEYSREEQWIILVCFLTFKPYAEKGVQWVQPQCCVHTGHIYFLKVSL